MPLDPKDPTGAFVRNMVDMRRFENTLSRETVLLIEATFSTIIADLIRLDPMGVSFGRRNRRVKALMKALEGHIGPLYTEVSRLVNSGLVDVADVQQAFAIKQLERAVGIEVSFSNPQPRSFWRSFVTDRRIRGAQMGRWWTDQSRIVRESFRREIEIGMGQGESIDDLVRRVRGRRVGSGFQGGTMRTTTRRAEALVRTAVNQISNDALFETFSANQNVTASYVYTATLDARTSDICISLDGQEFEYNDPSARKPPQHFQCRSTMIPIVDFEALGLDKPVEGKRAAKGGAVPATTDYTGWLRDQDPASQVAILGVGRAKLFREGKLDLRTIVRSDGSTISLADLRRRNT